MKNTENKKGKIFGIFNIVDIIIVLLIIVVGVVGFKIVRSKDKIIASGGLKTIQYTVEGQNVVKEAAYFPKVGDEVYNSSTSEYLGVLTEVRVEEQMRIDYNNVKGIYEKHPAPNLYTVYVTIEGEGYDDNQNITVNDAVVKVGKDMSIKGKGYAFMGYIVDINLGE